MPTPTFIGSAEAINDGAGTTLDATLANAVLEDDLLVGMGKHEGAADDFSMQKDSGAPANVFRFDAGDEVNHANGDLNAHIGYVLRAAADTALTVRMTTLLRTFRGLLLLHFRPPAGYKFVKSARNIGQGTGTAAASGVIDARADDVVIGMFAQYGNVVLSNREINNVAADAFEDAVTSDFSTWYRIPGAGFIGGNADVTQDTGLAWICNAMGFRLVSTGVRTDTTNFPVPKLRMAA